MTLTDYLSYFTTGYSSSNSHQDCMQIISPLNLKMGANCDQSLDTSQIHYDSSNNIVVETATPFDKYLCIEASTKGKKTARSIIQFEICGN